MTVAETKLNTPQGVEQLQRTARYGNNAPEPAPARRKCKGGRCK
jgi:hypothetical protein